MPVPRMIEIDGIVKRFGRVAAVDGISFTVPRGSVCGFLGPNGAGKTTTIRIVVGVLAADAGRVAIDGRAMGADGAAGAAVRRSIGFLPEESPLQPDLSVDEFLRFRADLYGVPRRDRAAAIDRALARCQVADVRRRLCGQLSKGYRQRVGLAGAIVHGPRAVVLDEPTSGLDPAQVREFRRLLRELAGEATVLLSSHVLAEVEASCDRAVLVDRGRVVADGTLPELRARGAAAATLALEAERDCAALLRALPGVQDVRAARGDDGWWRIQVDAVDAGIADAAARATAAAGIPLRRAELREASLEDVFHRMVPRAGGAA